MPLEKAITIKEAAEALNTSEVNLYRLTSAGKVPFFRLGGSICFLPSQLEKFMLGEWMPNAPKRQRGRQLSVYPQTFNSETDPRFQ